MIPLIERILYRHIIQLHLWVLWSDIEWYKLINELKELERAQVVDVGVEGRGFEWELGKLMEKVGRFGQGSGLDVWGEVGLEGLEVGVDGGGGLKAIPGIAYSNQQDQLRLVSKTTVSNIVIMYHNLIFVFDILMAKYILTFLYAILVFNVIIVIFRFT